eukprot:scaffold110457_cov46-Attheya_sp.AAC.1
MRYVEATGVQYYSAITEVNQGHESHDCFYVPHSHEPVTGIDDSTHIFCSSMMYSIVPVCCDGTIRFMEQSKRKYTECSLSLLSTQS